MSIHFPVFCKFCYKWSNFISDNANILESSLLSKENKFKSYCCHSWWSFTQQNPTECISFLMVIQELMLYTKQKISTYKIIFFFFQILHNRLKHLGIVFLIQAQDDVADIYEIVDFFFYGLIFHLYTIKI